MTAQGFADVYDSPNSPLPARRLWARLRFNDTKLIHDFDWLMHVLAGSVRATCIHHIPVSTALLARIRSCADCQHVVLLRADREIKRSEPRTKSHDTFVRGRC